jgi:argininosuccinate lyase
LSNPEENMKLWGGRFAKQTDSLAHRYNASLPFDQRLFEVDITASVAWARALVGAGVLSTAEMETIVAGLDQVRAEICDGSLVVQAADEDIHTLVERRLTEIVGPVGGKLHSGRSRNDQVATDFRLWVMEAADSVIEEIGGLQRALVDGARADLLTPLPGYTHLQHAQPVTWGHWLLAHFWALTRDAERFKNARAAAAVLPLGSGALAGTSFDIDRQALADELGFDSISQNSLDGVSDRDFAADFLYAATMLGLHLSRLSEQLILYSSPEFGFVVMDDAYSTGSSLMPQKKNPDMLELTRGKAGRLIGNLTGLLAVLKGLPSAYDKDLQEDKEPVFDAFDTLALALPVMAGVISTMRIRPERMAASLEPSMLATDLADYLVKAGLPFRQAHEVAGQAVQLAEREGVRLDELTLAQLQGLDDRFEEDVTAVFDVAHSLNSRAVEGGTAAEALERQLAAAEARLRS